MSCVTGQFGSNKLCNSIPSPTDGIKATLPELAELAPVCWSKTIKVDNVSYTNEKVVYSTSDRAGKCTFRGGK